MNPMTQTDNYTYILHNPVMTESRKYSHTNLCIIILLAQKFLHPPLQHIFPKSLTVRINYNTHQSQQWNYRPFTIAAPLWRAMDLSLHILISALVHHHITWWVIINPDESPLSNTLQLLQHSKLLDKYLMYPSNLNMAIILTPFNHQ